jgi:hypothetical protein
MKLNILSLGAGVQSTTLALMAAHGEIGPMPDCAIFADTQAEPGHVYRHLEWMRSPNVLPYPVHIVTQGNLFELIGTARPTGRWPHMPIPAFVEGKDGKGALLNRSCTADFKIVPIIRKVRELAGLTRKRSPKYPVVTQWIGISTDEAHRAKPARDAWIEHRFPLIEAGMSRGDCLQWMERNGYPKPAKSSCTFCPYHSDAAWLEIRDNDPEAWAQAVEVDERIRSVWHGRASDIYLHRSMKPLSEVEFSGDNQPDMFGNECEGMCGV